MVWKRSEAILKRPQTKHRVIRGHKQTNKRCPNKHVLLNSKGWQVAKEETKGGILKPENEGDRRILGSTVPCDGDRVSV
jgi:hypothetical protein